MAFQPRYIQVQDGGVGQLDMEQAVPRNVPKACGSRAVGQREKRVQRQTQMRAVHGLDDLQRFAFRSDVLRPRQGDKRSPASCLARAFCQLGKVVADRRSFV